MRIIEHIADEFVVDAETVFEIHPNTMNTTATKNRGSASITPPEIDCIELMNSLDIMSHISVYLSR